MNKIGIFGGTFDPVHNGHLLLAEEVLEQADLDKVLFMPTRIQPFKQDLRVSSAEDRLGMLSVAVNGNDALGITEVETERREVSYTIHSLYRLRAMLGEEAEVCFIVGSDMFPNMDKWYRAGELLREFPVVVGLRPGSDGRVGDCARRLAAEYGADVVTVRNRMFDVSSTDIKARVRMGRSIRYLVPDGVREYIYAAKLYAED
ncbi:MAG: nicotinate-nucleotide adenylyltransferase [Clostridiales Family XIII bacterium]|nr:nicotinate-nucleotide adenylyltransferase [Clostridiales Family XIII bacterium]